MERKPKPEDRLQALLEAQHNFGGTISEAELIRIIEEVKAYRAQQKASTYALWAATFAGFSVVVSGLSIVISLMRH
jgi:hypothetical protein